MKPAMLPLFIATGLLAAALELVALAGWLGWAGPRAQPSPVRMPLELAGRELPRLALPAPAQATGDEAQFAQLRERLRWIEVRIEGRTLQAPDTASRILLARSAARRARLHEVGLGFADVYGLINAETSWVPRTGASRDGTPNLGIAQFEPATAAALGVRDPHDVVEAVHAAAEHMREAAQWSASRLAGLRLSAAERARRLREGVSIYYNLSSRGRAAWDGRNVHQLPAATRSHIRNARLGAREAAWLARQPEIRQALAAPPAAPVVTASIASGAAER